MWGNRKSHDSHSWETGDTVCLSSWTLLPRHWSWYLYIHGINFSDFWDYEYALSQQIKDVLNTSFPIEIKVVNDAPLSFCFHVIRGKLLLTRDEDSLVDYMVRIAKTYLDIAPLQHYYMMNAMAWRHSILTRCMLNSKIRKEKGEENPSVIIEANRLYMKGGGM